jgi:hypothetical protein
MLYTGRDGVHTVSTPKHAKQCQTIDSKTNTE